MGDASQATIFDESVSNDTDLIQRASATTDHLAQQDQEPERFAVLYSHEVGTNPPSLALRPNIRCSNFEELLYLLEDDRVGSIWFDETVNSHEKSYIAGWARIFRPDLTAHNLQREKMAN